MKSLDVYLYKNSIVARNKTSIDTIVSYRYRLSKDGRHYVIER